MCEWVKILFFFSFLLLKCFILKIRINSIDHILLYVPEMLNCSDNTISCILINTILIIFIHVTCVRVVIVKCLTYPVYSIHRSTCCLTTRSDDVEEVQVMYVISVLSCKITLLFTLFTYYIFLGLFQKLFLMNNLQSTLHSSLQSFSIRQSE